MCNKDILEIIHTEDIPHLRDIYKKYCPSTLYVYNYLNSTLKWKRRYPGENFVTLLTPYGKWQDGTFIAFHQFHGYEVYMFTLEKDCSNLYHAIVNTTKVDWSRRTLIYAVLIDHYPTVRKALNHTEFTILQEIPCSIWWMPIKTALDLKTKCPPEIYMSKLEKNHASTINYHWPHKYPDSEKYLAFLIDVNGGYGLFLKTNHVLVAWILRIQIGLGTLQVVEEYKRKGYGSLVAKILAKRLAEEGINPVASILDNNDVSQSMFKKLGFEKCASVVYLENYDAVS